MIVDEQALKAVKEQVFQDVATLPLLMAIMGHETVAGHLHYRTEEHTLALDMIRWIAARNVKDRERLLQVLIDNHYGGNEQFQKGCYQMVSNIPNFFTKKESNNGEKI